MQISIGRRAGAVASYDECARQETTASCAFWAPIGDLRARSATRLYLCANRALLSPETAALTNVILVDGYAFGGGGASVRDVFEYGE
jgi:hypothetical protein